MDRGQKYRKNIGNKFLQDGSVRRFPGNTVISFIDHASPVFSLFCDVRRMLASSEAGDCFTWLPDGSIHMTVFEGVCDQWRDRAVWTSLLPCDAPLSDVDMLFETAFRSAPELGSVSMRTLGIKSGGGYSIALTPNTQDDALALAAYRNHLSKLFGLRFRNHDTYQYHISICYGTKAPSPEQNAALDMFERDANAFLEKRQTVFAITPPRLTYFESMFAFETTRFKRPQG